MQATNLNMTHFVGCKKCLKLHEIKVNEGDFYRWLAGSLIQNAMPYLTPDERELLITGICGKCFDEIFPEEE